MPLNKKGKKIMKSMKKQYGKKRGEQVFYATLNKKKILKSKNESMFIPKGAIHRIENPFKKTVKILEIQKGSILKTQGNPDNHKANLKRLKVYQV